MVFWAKWDPIWAICRKGGQNFSSKLELGEKNDSIRVMAYSYVQRKDLGTHTNHKTTDTHLPVPVHRSQDWKDIMLTIWTWDLFLSPFFVLLFPWQWRGFQSHSQRCTALVDPGLVPFTFDLLELHTACAESGQIFGTAATFKRHSRPEEISLLHYLALHFKPLEFKALFQSHPQVLVSR